ncbi:MAG: hypothetical protein ABFR89_02430 [Actinomycetota bacterium]
MATERIPERFVHICDRCGYEVKNGFDGHIDLVARDYQGGIVAGQKLDLCGGCTTSLRKWYNTLQKEDQ